MSLITTRPYYYYPVPVPYNSTRYQSTHTPPYQVQGQYLVPFNKDPVDDLAVIIFDQAEIPDYKMKMAKPGHIDINAMYIFYLE